MNWMDGLRQAVQEMLHHKLRTLLTLLGMVFGVGAVIAMLSIGEGAQQEALRVIETMGVRNLVVNAKQFDSERLKEIREHSSGLSLRDRDAALETLPFVVANAAEKNVRTFALFSLDGKSEGSVLAVTPSWFELSRLRVNQGRMFSAEEDLNAAPVAVLGAQAAAELFPAGPALGGKLKINHLWVSVIGVLEDKHLNKKEFQGVKLNDPRNQVFIPLHTALHRLKRDALADEVDALRFELEAGADPEVTAQALTHLFNRRHANTDDFEIVVPAALLDQQRKTQRIFTIVMSCIAGISLLVGGIGIMNIMLATVLERTKEIGLLRALGARKKDIRKQFLTESFTISLVGAILGIVFGVVLALVIQRFAEWPVAWSLFSVVIAVGICLITGVVFGWYPARRAADLDPIKALHSE